MNTAVVVGALARVLRGHGGGLELVSDGPVPVARFTGMCAGCPGGLGCHEGLVVAPALLALPGVRGVEASGTRMDPAARARLQAAVTVRPGRTP